MNDPTYLEIKQVTKVIVQNSKKIGIFIINLELFKSVDVDVHFYNELDGIGVIDVKSLKLEGDDYLAWSNDDSYIVTYVVNKLNLELV